ncbi:MAG TPA: hypothetical protein VN524_02765 [Hyphomicrobiaceae bacterium]|jgi:hypothetical protein|nr:hypothetical protein [Hyphomicrobiaceae bacterium]
MIKDADREENEIIKSLFDDLMRAPLQKFPAQRGELAAPKEQGVYIIYSPSHDVLHVGSTPKARNGIAQRLRNHLSARSSFASRYLNGDGSRLRQGYVFRCLVVENRRLRALLEAFAIGHLCPAHIGHSSAVTAQTE